MMKTLIFLVTFAVLASPAYFRALRSVLGGSVASPDGLAHPAGLFIAGLVFIGALYLEGRVTSGFVSAEVLKKNQGGLSAEYIAKRGISKRI
jgi:hypothetical protein